MKEFSILHLSDLHMKKVDNSYSSTIRKLIEDIKERVQNINNIIIVVSGDIVDKGDYKTHGDIAFDFFKKLKEVLSDKVASIQIVPGNHDKVKNVIDERLVFECRKDEGLIKLNDNEWKYHMLSFSEYIKFANNVYHIYSEKNYTNTYGVDNIKIGNANLCFINLDTSWCALGGNKDKRNLRLGQFQLDKLKNDYQSLKNSLNCKGESFDLTIVVSHHPLEWLRSDEEEIGRDFLIQEDFLNTDIILCGHTHERRVNNWYNHKKSLVTLVTGIGWAEENPSDTKEEHRYSIYKFNCNLNTCEIFMRKSNINGDFDFDYSIYTSESERKSKKLTYPIKTSGHHPYFEIPTYKENDIKAMYPSRIHFDEIRKYSLKLNTWRDTMTQMRETHKMDFLFSIDNDTEDQCENLNEKFSLLDDYFFGDLEDGDMCNELKKVFSSKKNEIFSNFDSYLREICNQLVNVFYEDLEEEESVRVHFRWYNKAEDSYHRLCSCTIVRRDNEIKNTIEQSMREVPWISLIKDSYDTKKPLVYSANRTRNAIHPDNWSDFITIVPIFNKHEYQFSSKRARYSRPIFSFGISCNMNRCSEILNLLNYLGVGELVGEIIENYLMYFPFEPIEFIESL